MRSKLSENQGTAEVETGLLQFKSAFENSFGMTVDLSMPAEDFFMTAMSAAHKKNSAIIQELVEQASYIVQGGEKPKISDDVASEVGILFIAAIMMHQTKGAEDLAIEGLYKPTVQDVINGILIESKGKRLQKLLRLPEKIHNHTFEEKREFDRAIADAPFKKYWAGVEGENALRHAIPGGALQTKFIPSQRFLTFHKWVNTSITHENLEDEISKFDFDANLLFGVCLSLCIERSHFTATLDELGSAIGWEPRSAKERESNRLKIWSWLLKFDSCRVVGLRKGSYTDEKKRRRDLTSNDDLIHISGTREEVEGGIPYEVTLSAGPWIDEMKGNKQILTHLGNLKQISSIPRGQLAGRLAVKLAFSLSQYWRQESTDKKTEVKQSSAKNTVSVQFAPCTRKAILTVSGEGNAQEVEDMLKSTNPKRAFDAWETAIRILKEKGMVSFYKEVTPLPRGYGKGDFWYAEQEIDIRPGEEMAKDIAEVNAAKKARTRRGTQKPKSSSENQVLVLE